MNKKIAILSIILSIVISIALHSPLKAETMPDFSLPIYKSNTTFQLKESVKGKKVLLNFWASWCTSCAHEIKELEALKAKYGDSVVFVGVNAGEKNNLIEKFINKHKFTFIQVVDENREFSKKLGVNALPVTMVIDSNMNIVFKDVRPPKEL
jgi:thiol-disulfide isomerase/thioredoxin